MVLIRVEWDCLVKGYNFLYLDIYFKMSSKKDFPSLHSLLDNTLWALKASSTSPYV